MLPLFVLHFLLWVKMVNPCHILGYNLLDKIASIIFIERQEMPRNVEPFLCCSLVNIHGTHLAETFDISKMLV